jgi:hypothetical protein
LLDSNIDEQLAALGQVPADLQALVQRIIGDQAFTLVEIDSTLASLADGRALPVPATSSIDRAEGASFVAPVGPVAAPVAPSSIPSSLITSSPLIESPLITSAAPLFDSRPPPPSVPPPVFEMRSAPANASSPRSSVFDEKPEPEYAETTAQAIVAAFDDSDSEARSELPSPPDPLDALALELGTSSPVESPPGRPLRRAEMRGSRRPDLDELLDQPLDALDFERTEPVPNDTDAEARSSEIPTDLPPAGAPGDDFEILVDDEILEIAEDDVELVDDDSSS